MSFQSEVIVMKKFFYILQIFLFCFFFSSLFFYNKPKKYNSNNLYGNLYITGSSSTQQLCDDLGDGFSKVYPKTFVVKSGSGSSQAVLAVLNKSAQIGDLSRELSSFENKELFNSFVIAKDAIAICTNKNNPIENIPFSTLQKIFQKKITNWAELGGKNKKIILIGRDFSSGTRNAFEKHLNLKNPAKYDIELENNGKVKYKIQNDEDAIGYISLSSCDDSINIVKIDRIYPSIENVINSKYHITHPLLQITKKGAKDPLLAAWFSFIYSDKGAAIIKQNRFIPVPRN